MNSADVDQLTADLTAAEANVNALREAVTEGGVDPQALSTAEWFAHHLRKQLDAAVKEGVS